MTLSSRTLWGMTPAGLVESFWKQRGVQLVTPGKASGIEPGSELFLLTQPGTLVLFDLRTVVERFQWISPIIMSVRLHAANRMTRVGMTANASIAEQWRGCKSTRELWQTWRAGIHGRRRAVISCQGCIGDEHCEADTTAVMCRLALAWRNPELEIDRAQKVHRRIWKDAKTTLTAPIRANSSTIWLGAGQDQIPSPGDAKAMVFWDLRDTTFAPGGARRQTSSPT